ncbi:MAG: hypothetical protein LBV12_03420 [Puniceicoccales bacterium]|jgi:hypothetical protein|nr:hypothetical protein [Puniceicoccales bacterium]
MQKQQRYLVFAIGVLIGCVIVVPIFSARKADKARQEQLNAGKQLPGMFVEAAMTGIPIREENQKFILEEGTETPPEGFAHRRVFITGGRRKFETSGRIAAEDFIKVTEDYDVAQPTATTPVKQFTFTFADRVRVKLADGATVDALEKLAKEKGGIVEQPQAGSLPAEGVIVRLAGHTLSDVPDMLAFLREHPETVSAAEAVEIKN